MKQTSTEYYICKRMRLLSFLIKRGFEVIETIPDANNPSFNCWLFVKTPELMTAVNEYYSLLPTV